MTLAADIDFVGIPYRDRGRDMKGCDCWGLIRMYFDWVLGVELPSFDGTYSSAEETAAVARLVESEKLDWQVVDVGSERRGDIALMWVRNPRWATHCGVVLEPGKMLHTRKGVGSCIQSYRHGFWVNRVVGFYRFISASAVT